MSALPAAETTYREAVKQAIRDAMSRDERVFWVCPLVEENEDLDLTAAGWIVQSRDELDITAGRGVAVRRASASTRSGSLSSSKSNSHCCKQAISRS